MEVCVDSLESAMNAAEGGASRIELCSSLALGGTTPTLGLLKCIKQKLPQLIIFVLIRCRDGDFLYTDDEVEVMIEDVKCLVGKGWADGIVIGCLAEHGNVHTGHCKRLITAAKDVSVGRKIDVTFHRAFDMACCTLPDLVDTIIHIGCSRILTSGQKNTAIEGIPFIRELIEKFGDRIVIMPGGGLNEGNLGILLDSCVFEPDTTNDTKSGKRKYKGIQEFHASAKTSKESRMKYRNKSLKMGSSSDEYTLTLTSVEKVRKMVDIFSQFCNLNA